MNTTKTHQSLHNRLDELTRDGGGAQAEPYVSVRSAHIQPGNPRTGSGSWQPTAPASENEAGQRTAQVERPIEVDETPSEGGDSEATDLRSEIDSDPESDEDLNLWYEPEAEPEIPRPKRTKPRKVDDGPKQGIKIGSLNMRGRNTRESDGRKMDKFDWILKWMRGNQINILTLQDTHWSESIVEQIRLKHTQVRIEGNHGTTNRGGIAFIIDERKEKLKREEMTIIEQGRSAVMQLEFENQHITLATVYMPNEKSEKLNTLRALRKGLRRIANREELILTGDFNMVERSIDRHPPHNDEREITEEMTKLTTTFQLNDGWRSSNGDAIAFTWRSGQRADEDYSFSRIDRIYVTNKLIDRSNEWNTERIENRISDHAAVTVKITDPESPTLGRGEWRLNLKILEHPHFIKAAANSINKLEMRLTLYKKKAGRYHKNRDNAGMQRLRQDLNPQIEWKSYKESIKTAAEEATVIRAKAIMKKRRGLERQIKAMERELQKERTSEKQKDLRISLANLENEISELLEVNRKKAEATVAAKWFTESEKGTRLWYSLNKEQPRRQIFYSLLDSEGLETCNSERMLSRAQEYHKDLQKHQEMTHERELAIEQILAEVDREVTTEQSGKLTERVTYEEIETTMKKSPCGKSPGCDGIPNEFWKQEVEWRKDAEKTKVTRPDIIKCMRTYINDIEMYGPIDGDFAEGRMSLLYKKKDRRDIVNYRPVTLINTDYKIYTKILTKRMNKIAPDLIHPDQAGFMPNRSIYDQTKLTELVIKLCDNNGTNGMIMALDQEKAYDKIDHEYLWRTLRAFNFPDQFINRVKSLYHRAKTAIRLNGHVSEAFDVQRGVRQGDPLSCLLYNLAIEPLMILIRKSELKGIKIHNNTENVKVSVYADDTTVYLNEEDDPEILEECLTIFCKASTAKFNDNKTEIIPLGSQDFRESLITTRIFKDYQVKGGTKIAEDGQAVRILGSWQGNNINAIDKWNEIIDKQMKIMKMWSKTYPTTTGRVLVAKSLVVSRALYLMMVNGIPREYLDRMERNIKDFIWLGKRGEVNWRRAILPKDQGGISAPSVKLIYEATKVVWIRKWLTPEENKPKWIWAANAIIENNAQTNPPVDRQSITDWVEQSWEIKVQSHEIPQSLREIVKAARKYNIKVSILRAPMDLKMKMPAFYHPGIKSNVKTNSSQAKCLRRDHGISSMEDLVIFAQKLDINEEHSCVRGTERCRAYANRLLANINELWNPITNSPTKNSLYHTPRRLKLNKEADIKIQTVTYDPNPTKDSRTKENIRIFGERRGYIAKKTWPETPRRPIRNTGYNPDAERETIDLYTDGSSSRNGWENSQTGIGIWHEEGSKRNCSMRLDEGAMTNQRAELAAILQALRMNQKENLRIFSDSLTSLTTICYKLTSLEDIAWNRVKNADLLQEILALLRTREGTTEFKWVKGHSTNLGNQKADELADLGQKSDIKMRVTDPKTPELRALHDGARLSKLTMRTIYSILVQRHTAKIKRIKNIDKIQDAKILIERETGLRPPDERIIKNIWRLPTNNRIKDHIWKLLHGRIKCGSFWSHIPGYERREFCASCGDKQIGDIIESEHHMWLECEENGQKEAWILAKRIWQKTTYRPWPEMSMGLIRGTGALNLETKKEDKQAARDTERLQILISMTVWAIWKTRNNFIINNIPVHRSTAKSLLTELIKEDITKRWNATNIMKKNKQAKQRKILTELWYFPGIARLETGKQPEFFL